jgi:zinc transporter
MSQVQPPEGLIHALLLDGRGGAVDLSWAQVRQWSPESGCLWLHFNFEEPESRQWVQSNSGLDDIASAALLTEETRPRAISRGQNLLLALRGVNLNPGSDPDDMVSLRLWTDGLRVVSTRRRKLLSTDDLIEQLELGTGPTNAASLLVGWIDRIVWRMSDTVDRFEDEVLELEEAVLAGELEGLRLKLATLRKQTISIRRYLAPQREALNRVVAESFNWFDEIYRLRLREVADRQIRHIEDIDEVRERAAMAQEELLSRVSEQMNKRTYVLTVVAAIFLPLGFFTGLMGINVGGMPGIDDDTAFWVVAGICVGITAGLAALFRLKRWL